MLLGGLRRTGRPIVGGDTGPLPKPGKGSGAVADDRGGDGRAGMDMGITGVLCINELKL